MKFRYLIMMLVITACGSPKQRPKVDKADFLKNAKVFAESVPAGTEFKAQSITTQSADASNQCNENLDPLISEANAGTAALMVALAGAMASLQASTDKERTPSPPPAQIAVTPVKAPSHDRMVAALENQNGRAGFEAWPDGGPKLTQPAVPPPAQGNDNIIVGVDRAGSNGRNSNNDQVNAGIGNGATAARGNDNLQVLPAAFRTASVNGDAAVEDDQKMAPEAAAYFANANNLTKGREDYRANQASRKIASLDNSPAGRAGVAPESGPNLFKIVTYTYGDLCSKRRLNIACSNL